MQRADQVKYEYCKQLFHTLISIRVSHFIASRHLRQNWFDLTEMSQRPCIRACHTSLPILLTELSIRLLYHTMLSTKKMFPFDKKRNILIMGNSDVSKVLVWIEA